MDARACHACNSSLTSLTGSPARFQVDSLGSGKVGWEDLSAFLVARGAGSGGDRDVMYDTDRFAHRADLGMRTSERRYTAGRDDVNDCS